MSSVNLSPENGTPQSDRTPVVAYLGQSLPRVGAKVLVVWVVPFRDYFLEDKDENIWGKSVTMVEAVSVPGEECERLVKGDQLNSVVYSTPIQLPWE